MQAAKLPFSAGLQWVQAAFSLFKKQPMALLAITFIINFISQILIILPLIGLPLFIVSIPISSLVMVSACRSIDGNNKVIPAEWILPLKKPGVIQRLAIIGFLYASIFVLITFISFYPTMNALSHEDMQKISRLLSDPEYKLTLNDIPSFSISIFQYALWAILTFLTAITFWHVPQLIGWENMSVKKALFYSLVASWRNKLAFIVYFSIWGILFYASQFLLTDLMMLMGLPLMLVAFVAQILVMIIAVSMYCGFYSSYVAIFGKPDIRTIKP
ncbi:BPSS1780 family membrane protein [Advenella faeciporci]|nr:BPSS1780 family membrane protein [Advenella faeciporci]NLY34663.1 hypothetical protein [Alcaligenaceae bacterium]